MTRSIADDDVATGASRGFSEEWVDYSAGHAVPLKPVRIPEWEWMNHPLLVRAVAERWISGDEIHPTGLDAAQARALEKLHIVVEHGDRVVSMPPRFNADPFVDGVDVSRADDLIDGLHPDLDRFYFRCAQPSGDYIETYAAVSDGRKRRFFVTQYGPLWVEVDVATFAARMRDEASTMTEVTRHGIHAFERQLMAQFGLSYHIADKSPLNPAWSRFLQTELPRTTAVVAVVADASAVGHGAHVGDPAASAPQPRADHGQHRAAAVEAVESAAEAAVATGAPVAPPVSDEPAPRDPQPPAVGDAGGPSAPAAAEDVPEAPPVEVMRTPAAEEAAPAVVPEPAAARDEVAAVVQLARASAIATIVHRGQADLTGAPYIDHPARIADEFDPIDDAVAASAAWLHDVFEDTDVTEADLRDAGIDGEVIAVVALLTRRDDVPDEEYYGRIRANETARRVKLADIADNTAPWRLRRLDEADRARLTAKYDAARRALLG